MATDWGRLATWYRWQESLERPGLEAVVALARPQTSEVVVDLGCGPGTLARHLRRADVPVLRLVGVDQEPAMLDRAASAGMEVVRADVRDVPLPDGLADLVVCAWVLHLLDDEARMATLAEVARLIVAGGRGVVVVPALPRTAVGRAVRTVAGSVAGAALRVVDVDPAITRAGLVTTDTAHVGSTRWGYEADVRRLEHGQH